MNSLSKDKYLSEIEVQELNRVLDMIRSKNERDVLLIELALNCGAREEELTKITRDDLDKHLMTVFISQPGKGSNKREVALSREFFARLWTYAQKVNGPLFPISTARIRQIWGDIRPVKKKFHGLRHTFARNLYAKTRDIRLVQKTLGHRSIANTQIYTDIDYDGEALRKAMGL